MIKSIGALLVLITSVVLMFACSPAGASELVAEQSQMDLFVLLEMIMNSWADLSWPERLLLLAFAGVPVASVFTSITPTPRPGTLWSFIYGYLELNALKFFRSKDKYADTVARKIDKKPLDLEKDNPRKVNSVTATLSEVAVNAAMGGPKGVVLGLLRKLF